jgi:hypothetical protein
MNGIKVSLPALHPHGRFPGVNICAPSQLPCQLHQLAPYPIPPRIAPTPNPTFPAMLASRGASVSLGKGPSVEKEEVLT